MWPYPENRFGSTQCVRFSSIVSIRCVRFFCVYCCFQLRYRILYRFPLKTYYNIVDEWVCAEKSLKEIHHRHRAYGKLQNALSFLKLRAWQNFNQHIQLKNSSVGSIDSAEIFRFRSISLVCCENSQHQISFNYMEILMNIVFNEHT